MVVGLKKRQVAPPNYVRMERLTKEQVLAQAKLREAKIKQTEELKKVSTAGRKRYLAAEKAKRKEHTLLRWKAAKSEGKIFYRRPDAKVALVIRIRGINRLSPRVKKIMDLLRLRQIHNAVFVKLNACTINMLKLVLPYIAYGYPTRDMIELETVEKVTIDMIKEFLSRLKLSCHFVAIIHSLEDISV